MGMKEKDWRDTSSYRRWRKKVISSGKCVICGSTENLEAHHLNHATYFPELRFRVLNGATLCRGCHSQFHTNFKRSFKQKCTRYDFDNFVVLSKYFKQIFSK